MNTSNGTINTVRGLERPVPNLPWGRIMAIAAIILLGLLVAWEVQMRRVGLQVGDLKDGRDFWAVERRKVDAGPADSIVLIGDSRMLFDSDLATWQRVTGRRPIQLAMMGANARPMLDDLANDTHFAGLVVVGTAEFSYFNDDDGSSAVVLHYVNNEGPSKRIGHVIYQELSRHVAFLDPNYALFPLVERHHWPERKDVSGPYMDVWKVSETYDHRQSYLWEELEKNPYLLDHTRQVWLAIYDGPPVTADELAKVDANAKDDIDRIRARGGEVVWLRPPSAGPILKMEQARFPRAQVWDQLLRATHSFGVYFADYPDMQNFTVPDYSHLSRSSALAFSNAYVQVFQDKVPWLKAHERNWTAQ